MKQYFVFLYSLQRLNLSVMIVYCEAEFLTHDVGVPAMLLLGSILLLQSDLYYPRYLSVPNLGLKHRGLYLEIQLYIVILRLEISVICSNSINTGKILLLLLKTN